MREIRSTRANETLAKLELAERGIQDAVIALFLLFTGFVALNIIAMLLYGGDLPIEEIIKSNNIHAKVWRINVDMAKYVIPWVNALAFLIIARELWLMRVYLEGIHIGFELESMINELKGIEKLEEREEEDLEKIEEELTKLEELEEEREEEKEQKPKKRRGGSRS